MPSFVPMRRTVTILAALLLGAATLEAQRRDTLRMAFVGDINFARSLARNYLFTGRGTEVFARVRDRLRAADVAVGNLESILLERGRRADTTNSPVFAGPQREAIPLILDAGFDVMGTANNHAWDFGRAGLLENLRWLDSAGIVHTGTGRNLEEAWRPALLRVKGWTVAIFGITAMFNYPDLTVIGHDAECCVAWLDTIVAARRFRAARDSLGADIVIAYVHQGQVEYRALPDDAVIRQFRALARQGVVDAIIGHHPHVPQGIEWVDGVPIVYSLGNFVFKQRQPWTDRGLWAELEITERTGDTTRTEETTRTERTGRTGRTERTDSAVRTVRPVRNVRLKILPLVVGYTPHFATGRDSARVMAHVDSISRRLSGLPNPRPRRNVARPRTTRTPSTRP